MPKPKQFELEVIGTKNPDVQFTVTDKDAIIYALGIGFSNGIVFFTLDPMREEDYMYTYELNENFTGN